MPFNDHSDLLEKHSFLSPSKHHWTGYTDERLRETYSNFLASAKGTRYHEFASICIKLGETLPKRKRALNQFVNDAIGYRMSSEQLLYYSDNCYGTADAISFRDRKLRIHDLKTGETPVTMRQLEIYAALFCLEYEEKPEDIIIELRIYQGDAIFVHHPTPVQIRAIMDKIVSSDRLIEQIKLERRDDPWLTK